MNTSSNPCSHEKSPELIGLSNIATHEIVNSLILPVHKKFERVVVDVYVYLANLVGINLEIGTQRLVLEGKPPHQLSAIQRFPKDELLS